MRVYTYSTPACLPARQTGTKNSSIRPKETNTKKRLEKKTKQKKKNATVMFSALGCWKTIAANTKEKKKNKKKKSLRLSPVKCQERDRHVDGEAEPAKGISIYRSA